MLFEDCTFAASSNLSWDDKKSLISDIKSQSGKFSYFLNQSVTHFILAPEDAADLPAEDGPIPLNHPLSYQLQMVRKFGAVMTTMDELQNAIDTREPLRQPAPKQKEEKKEIPVQKEFVYQAFASRASDPKEKLDSLVPFANFKSDYQISSSVIPSFSRLNIRDDASSNAGSNPSFSSIYSSLKSDFAATKTQDSNRISAESYLSSMNDWKANWKSVFGEDYEEQENKQKENKQKEEENPSESVLDWADGDSLMDLWEAPDYTARDAALQEAQERKRLQKTQGKSKLRQNQVHQRKKGAELRELHTKEKLARKERIRQEKLERKKRYEDYLLQKQKRLEERLAKGTELRQKERRQERYDRRQKNKAYRADEKEERVRKLFVGGLTYDLKREATEGTTWSEKQVKTIETRIDMVKGFFRQFGEVLEYRNLDNWLSPLASQSKGSSKKKMPTDGWCFVVYSEAGSASKCLEALSSVAKRGKAIDLYIKTIRQKGELSPAQIKTIKAAMFPATFYARMPAKKARKA